MDWGNYTKEEIKKLEKKEKERISKEIEKFVWPGNKGISITQALMEF